MFSFLKIKNKKVVLCLLLLAVIAGYFWIYSRYPSLNKKAAMGDRIHPGGIISHEMLWPVSPNDPLVKRIAYTSVNWANTNKKGMTFGVLFAAALLTLFQFIRWRNGRNAFVNAIKGAIVGAPLGVCANCAAPIEKTMRDAGSHPETSIAAMMSSPTLNVVAIAMLFALFPFYFAVTKIILTVLFILAVTPLLIRWDRRHAHVHETPEKNIKERADTVRETWIQAAGVFIKTYFSKLWFVFKTTVPLMALAGILGAALAETIPLEKFTFGEFSGLPLLVVSTIGTILPVPVLFDIIATHSIFSAGASAGISMALLFTLGIISIYPLLLIARTYSFRLSAMLFVATILFGFAGGYAAEYARSLAVSHARAEIAAAKGQMEERYMKFLPSAIQNTCAEKDDSELSAEECIPTLLFREARNSGSEVLCDMVSGTVQANCHAEALIGRALASRDADTCDSLNEDDVLRLKCKAEVAFSLARAASRLEICDSYDENIRTRCRAKFLGERAGLVPGYCNGIETLEEKYLCIEEAVKSMVKQKMRFNNDFSCSALPASKIKELCTHEEKVAKAFARLDVKKTRFFIDERADKDEKIPVRNSATSQEAPSSRPPLRTEPKQVVYSHSGIIVEKQQNKQRTESASEALFESKDADIFGITKYNEASPLDFVSSFRFATGITTGDYNNDGWTDLALATNSGVLLYENIGGKFDLVRAPVPGSEGADTFLVAFIDMDNDGWQDIVFSQYGGRVLIVLNDRNGFLSPLVRDMPNVNSRTVGAASFADIDRNGLLDIAIGNWAGVSQKSKENVLLFNHFPEFARSDFKDASGYTLSALLSDINGDRRPDLLLGNDLSIPDAYYLGSEQGFVPISDTAGLIPATPYSTMSIDTGDVNNDLYQDIFSVDLMSMKGPEMPYCEAVPEGRLRDNCNTIFDASKIIDKGDAAGCMFLPSGVQAECIAGIAQRSAMSLQDASLCELMPAWLEWAIQYCKDFSVATRFEVTPSAMPPLPQLQNNVLLLGSAEMGFKDVSEKWGVQASHWSWNAKFADVDNDEWQDIYVGNGFPENTETFSNVFFHNKNGAGFESAAKAFGLEDFLHTSSYIYIDIDNDGDLDIIATSFAAPPRVFINGENKNHSVSFEIRDKHGNHFGIGTKVFIFYGDKGEKHQMREIKSGGGFLSFDAPIAHFGLGNDTSIERVEIEWSTGEKTVMEQNLPADSRYIIQRK